MLEFVSRIPYNWIFPKINGVIHHGGSGTTHLALKYGCATMIIPHLIDQYVTISNLRIQSIDNWNLCINGRILKLKIFLQWPKYIRITFEFIRIKGRKLKSKLNLTIDKDLVPKSKAFARLRGKSVSQFVEDLLRNAINAREESFTDRWRGKFNILDKTDPRYQKLKRRYQL